jgi:hypothetical protein
MEKEGRIMSRQARCSNCGEQINCKAINKKKAKKKS